MQVRIPQLFEEIAANKPHGLQIDRGHNCYVANDNTRMIEHQSVVFKGVERLRDRALHKSKQARGASDSIKPGAQAPGSRNENIGRAREAGDSA